MQKLNFKTAAILKYNMAFFIFIQILMEHSKASTGYSGQMRCSTVSHLGLHCLPMSHKKDAMLI